MEIVGLGTDLVEVSRFRLAMERRGERLNERLFSDDERAYAARQKDPAKSLAARFGAKEAVMKAMGVGLWKFKLRDVEVARAKSGAPSVVNEKMPVMPWSTPTPGRRSAGTIACAQRQDSAKVSGVNSRTDGITGASLGWRIVAASMGIGIWAYEPTPSRSVCSRK